MKSISVLAVMVLISICFAVPRERLITITKPDSVFQNRIDTLVGVDTLKIKQTLNDTSILIRQDTTISKGKLIKIKAVAIKPVTPIKPVQTQK